MGRHSAAEASVMEPFLDGDLSEDQIPTEPIHPVVRGSWVPGLLILLGVLTAGVLGLLVLESWPGKVSILDVLMVAGAVSIPALAAVAASLIIQRQAYREW